jgi:hypothetical protein
VQVGAGGGGAAPSLGACSAASFGVLAPDPSGNGSMHACVRVGGGPGGAWARIATLADVGPTAVAATAAATACVRGRTMPMETISTFAAWAVGSTRTPDGTPLLITSSWGHGGAYSTPAVVWRWNGVGFETIQTLTAPVTTDVELYTIAGTLYLALASHLDGSGSYAGATTTFWRWVPGLGGLGGFAQFQSVVAPGAKDCEVWARQDGEYMMGIAQQYDGSTNNLNSRIWRVNATTGALTLNQSIATRGANDIEPFSWAGVDYIVFSNQQSGATWAQNSEVWRWTGGAYVLHQAIATVGASDFAIFSAAGGLWAFVSQYNTGTSYSSSARLYAWDSVSLSFVFSRSYPTTGGYKAEPFVVDGRTYVVQAWYRSDSSNSLNSYIYMFNGTQLVRGQGIATLGAGDVTVIDVGDPSAPLFHFAEYYDGTSYTLSSPLHQWMCVQRAA